MSKNINNVKSVPPTADTDTSVLEDSDCQDCHQLAGHAGPCTPLPPAGAFVLASENANTRALAVRVSIAYAEPPNCLVRLYDLVNRACFDALLMACCKEHPLDVKYTAVSKCPVCLQARITKLEAQLLDLSLKHRPCKKPKPRVIPAKVGTQSWVIILDRRTPLRVGAYVRFKEVLNGKWHGVRWQDGKVTQVDPLFISL